MRTRTAVATTRDTETAVRTIAAALAGGPPGFRADFVAIHTTVAHAGRDILAALGRVDLPGALHGGTSCRGLMTEEGFFRSVDGAIAAFAIEDPEGAYGTGAASLGSDARAASRQAVTAALKAAGRSGEAPDLVWLTVAPGREEAVLKGIADVVGPGCPVFGGSSADDDVTGRWFQFTRAGVLADGIVVSVLFPSRRIAFDYHSGYQPTDRNGVVTAAEGRTIRTIDGRPAFEVYREWTGGAIGAMPVDGPSVILGQSTFHPLGRHVRDVAGIPYFVLAHPSVAHPDGSMELFCDVRAGERLTLMTGDPDSLVGRAGRVARYALSNAEVEVGDVLGALVVYCGGCLLAVEDRAAEVVAGIDHALGGAPFLGVFTFGEQGCLWDDESRHGNLMISCAAFAR